MDAPVKIITEGALAAEKIYRQTCTSCGTIYEYARKEARYSSDQRDGDALVTDCPMPGCGCTNYSSIGGHSGSQWDR